MKFIVDTQLPFKLAVFLRGRGHDCIHTTDRLDGHLMQDAEIVKIAVEDQRTVITKDSDFKDHFHAKGYPPKVLYLTFGNISNKKLLTFFEEFLETILLLYDDGAKFIEFNQDGIFIVD